MRAFGTRPQLTRATQICAALGVVAFSSSLLTDPAGAQTQPPPNQVVGNCLLPTTAITGLRAALQGAGIPAPQIDFVVVYSLRNRFDGQAVTGGFTGPVLCRRGAFGSLPVIQVESVSQTDTIPPSGPGTVDLLDIETALITQYQTPSGPPVPDPNRIEKRFCHSVGEASSCFRISD